MLNDNQKGQLFGALDFASEKGEDGLTRAERFAAALDPLILPEMRMGEQIRAKGASRVKRAGMNKTVDWLKSNGYPEIASMVATNPNIASNVMSAIIAKKINPPAAKGQGQVVSAAELRKLFPGTQIADGIYNISPTGNITKVGGGGMNINMPGPNEFAKLDARALSEVGQAGAAAKRNLSRINRLESLLANVPTGMTANLKQLAGNFGITTEGLDDIQAAQALINSLVPEQRPAGSGPMSDADLELFKQSLPRIINQPNGNQIIIETMRGIAQYDAMGADIVQRHRDKQITIAEAFAELNRRLDPFENLQIPSSSGGAPNNPQGQLTPEQIEAYKLLNLPIPGGN